MKIVHVSMQTVHNALHMCTLRAARASGGNGGDRSVCLSPEGFKKEAPPLFCAVGRVVRSGGIKCSGCNVFLVVIE